MTGRHDGDHMSSDGGGLLLREVDGRIDLTRRLAGCFEDHRNAASVEHDVRALVAKRVHALALGYEDLNDHDALRRDAVLSLLTGRADPTGADRVRRRHRGAALASPSTLNRLELGQPERPRRVGRVRRHDAKGAGRVLARRMVREGNPGGPVPRPPRPNHPDRQALRRQRALTFPRKPSGGRRDVLGGGGGTRMRRGPL